MSSSLFVFLILVFFSMHACISHLLDEGAKKERLHETSMVDKQQQTEGRQHEQERQSRAASGHDILAASSFRMAFLEVIKIEGSARSMLEHDTEEAMDFKENEDVADDIVVMDYAQPHRKPPIHNEEP